jgi:uncharacterized protein (TIGR03382 family)
MLLVLPLLALWDDVTSGTIGTTAEWTSKLELADLDGDGWIDIVFANGGDYDTAGTPEPQRAFRNLGNWSGAGPHFEEISADVFGAAGTRLSRVIKIRDIDGDGDQDVFVGGAHGTASGLFRQGAGGTFADVSAASLPAGNVALGDAEFGDVDGDGDLDLVLADWGTDVQTGGPTRLWLNDGDGVFTDATAQMPTALVGMSWDLELVDIDDDADLDVLVSCKFCTGGTAYVNDGAGHFTDESAARLPQRSNNYEYEPMDIDGDGDLDLVTINDGPNFTETVLVNDGLGHFADESAARMTGANNVAGADDNCDTFLDVDADGDADWIIGSLSDSDRLMINDGSGHFTKDDTVLPDITPGTLGLLVDDLDHDGRLDVVESQGEAADPDKVFLANSGVAVDTAAPDVRILRAATVDDPTVIVRVHDHKSPSLVTDWRRIDIEITSPGTTQPVHMAWRGEYEWAATLAPATPGISYHVCAVDSAGNQACSSTETYDAAPDAGMGGDDDGGGDGCCSTGGGGATGGATLALLTGVMLVRRRRDR